MINPQAVFMSWLELNYKEAFIKCRLRVTTNYENIQECFQYINIVELDNVAEAWEEYKGFDSCDDVFEFIRLMSEKDYYVYQDVIEVADEQVEEMLHRADYRYLVQYIDLEALGYDIINDSTMYELDNGRVVGLRV